MAASKISLPSAGILNQIFQQVRALAQGNLGVPFMLMLMLGMMTLPVPTLLLDIFFTFNIALAIINGEHLCRTPAGFCHLSQCITGGHLIAPGPERGLHSSGVIGGS